MEWTQNYDPFGRAWLSTIVATLPVAVLLGSLAWGRARIHVAAGLGLASALILAIAVYGMPARVAGAAALYGAAYGLFPVGWIVLNLIFLYQLTVKRGEFTVLRQSLAKVSPDARVQVILVGFCLGAFFEGCAGFGTPVALTAAILIQLGFSPLRASGLSLIANTAPVAFGALGTPIIALSAVTGLDILQLSAMAGRILPWFSLAVPFWVVWALAGFRGMLGVWPVCLTAGLTFAVVQFLFANFHGPWLVDIAASISALLAVLLLLRLWQPALSTWSRDALLPRPDESIPTRRAVARAWMPWVILSIFVFVWGVPEVKNALEGSRLGTPSPVMVVALPVPGLHQVVRRTAPVAPAKAPPEKAVFTLNWLSATGTGIGAAALIAALLVMGYSGREFLVEYWVTIKMIRYSLLTMALMLALGYVTRYSGADATLGIALAKTGAFYPFCGTLLGWLGVALTGSDTASNVLFGGLQKITADRLGVSAVLMGAANTCGGVMGKMIDAQSILVASTATNWYGHEGEILRYVFFHSLALASLVGLLVAFYAATPFFVVAAH